MTHDPQNYRDPKVTTAQHRQGGAMRWVWIAVAAILVLLLLSWIFGGFGDDTVTTVPADPVAPAGDATVPAPTGDAGTAPAPVEGGSETAPVEGGTEAAPPAD